MRERIERIPSDEVNPREWDATSLMLRPPMRGTTWIFATKLDVLRNNLALDHSVGYAGRYGTLAALEGALRAAIEPGSTVVFLGDHDPLDLAVYLQLVAALPRRTVHFGFDERALTGVQVTRSWHIRMDALEQEAWAILRPELAETIGPSVTARLDAGMKTEVDSIWRHAREGALDVTALFRRMGIRGAKLRVR